MKKLLFILTVFVLTFSQSAKAQYENGDVLVNVGLGFGSYYATGSGFSTTLPPLEAGVEFFVADKFTVGGFIGAYGAKYEVSNPVISVKSKFNFLNIGALGNYHFVNTDQWNVYAGARLGYVNSKVDAENEIYEEDFIFDKSGAKTSGVLFGIQGGARYHFSESISANAELAWGVAVFKLGLTFKL